MTKWTYAFGDGAADGGAEMGELLGGKGANLAEMCRLGLPVPPGFTIPTEVCVQYLENRRQFPDGLAEAVAGALAEIGRAVDGTFGSPDKPLLVSVRSGARSSMPGMMDTVLNLGLNDETVKGLAKRSGDPRFAFDSYRRFIQMYADVALGVEHHYFEELLENHKVRQGITLDAELETDDLEQLVEAYREKVAEQSGRPFPQSVTDQLWGAIGAVFQSWTNRRAVTYRRLHDIPDDWGTAVNVQAMVFGNMGADSATGVAFTRDPSTGDKRLFGEFLINAQGEDVVAGLRTPQPLRAAAGDPAAGDRPSLETALPAIYDQLVEIHEILESHYRDMQDIEFTVQQGKLWMLQTRSGKRTAQAALKIAVDMANEGLIDRRAAVARIDPAALDQLLHPTLDPAAERKVIARGLPASPGAATGKAVFTADEATRLAAAGEKVILVRLETSPEDIHGMHAAQGILTGRGGMTSHAAVVARGMGRPCVCGASALAIDSDQQIMTVAGETIAGGDILTIDGASGEVMLGEVAMVSAELTGEFTTLMGWADKLRRLKVRANAETPAEAQVAREFGAEGIGLCRTEHMFFDAERIIAVREMILAGGLAERQAALAKLLPMQRQDFVDLFRIMAGLPVTIRLLDPPLHEFLPKTADEIDEVAAATGIDRQALRRRAIELEETNPMLGHRGCRLGISYPEIYQMQARAIFEAALQVGAEVGAPVVPEIMIPLIATHKELDILKACLAEVAETVGHETGAKPAYLLGTMIELPRAALMAGEIARSAEFFSFGTNDLTQTTFGISRDDARFLDTYVEQGIFEGDPFVSLDRDGVGQLMEMAVARGRASRADLKLGICGEHGGDPASIAYCHAIGLDYVSCSAYRVPIARLAAAQAAIAESQAGNGSGAPRRSTASTAAV